MDKRFIYIEIKEDGKVINTIEIQVPPEEFKDAYFAKVLEITRLKLEKVFKENGR